MQYIQIYGMMCCGTLGVSDPPKKDTGAGQELHNTMFKDPKHVLQDICESRYAVGQRSAFYIFTDNLSGRYGDILTNYIHKNKLGEVTRSQPGRNPNTTNIVVAYVWRINEPALYAYAVEKSGVSISLSCKRNTETWLSKYGDEYGEGNKPKSILVPHKHPHWHLVKTRAKEFIASALFE